MSTPKTHPATALKLHAFGIARLHDPNWTGCDLFDEVKRHTRGSREPTQLLRRPLAEGLAYQLGGWLFDDYLLAEWRLDDEDPESSAWFLEDYLQFLEFHAIDASVAATKAKRFLKKIEALYEKDEHSYYAFLESERGHLRLSDAYGDLVDQVREPVQLLRRDYSGDFADRILHDRQLCAHIAAVVVLIGFDGDDADTGIPSRWCERTRLPSWAKRALLARDRGKCSTCGKSLTDELAADPHVDHIVPLSLGGCNDLINLQILCQACNLKKQARSEPVLPSAPPYFSRVLRVRVREAGHRSPERPLRSRRRA